MVLTPQSAGAPLSTGLRLPLTSCLRRSPRLAAKTRGIKKSSLQRAQDLMCRKLKLVRLASKTPCLLPSLSVPAPAAALTPAVETRHTTPAQAGTHKASPTISNPQHGNEATPHLKVGVRASASTRNSALPLSQEKIQNIMYSCGIVDKGKRIFVSLSTLPNPSMGTGPPGTTDAGR